MEKNVSPKYAKVYGDERYLSSDHLQASFKDSEETVLDLGADLLGKSYQRKRASMLKICLQAGGAALLLAASFTLGWFLRSFDERGGLDTAWSKY
jgi:hypothetical protein